MERTYQEHGYTVRSEAGTEVEVQTMLYGLVLALKPKVVFESGCYDGFTTAALAEAQLKASRGGKVFACDIDKDYVRATEERLDIANAMLPGLRHVATVYHARAIDVPALRLADFLFCDSNYDCRKAEMLAAKPGCIIVCHDTRISYDGAIAPLGGWLRDRGGLTFDTYRGFGIIRVPEGGLRP
jgi:predicted O-methyltransferase YrrM